MRLNLFRLEISVKIHRVTSIYYKGSKIHDIYASLQFSFIFHATKIIMELWI